MTAETSDPALAFPGPVALVAGPGSGKTTQLARRIKWLIEDCNAEREHVTVITFTVEAARNMKERLSPPAKEGMPDVTLPSERHPTTICTMHSLGWTIVRQNAARLGMPQGCNLLPPHLRRILFEDAARLCSKDTRFGEHCTNRKSRAGEPADDRERHVFDTYRRILQACNAIDYDDQIILACQVLREHDDVREAWQLKSTHLLVDEYQDINRPQLELIQILSARNPSGLFVVGDDDQSIYRFRGAEPNHIRNFDDYFSGGNLIKIPDCFRCQPHIIHAAHGVIEAFNPERIPKPEPQCAKPEGMPVTVHSVASDAQESALIAAKITDALREGDVLVLLPKPDYADPLKAELTKRRVAFDAPKPRPTEAARVFAALSDWLVDQDDNLAFRELLSAVCDGGILGLPGPRVHKAAKVAEREEALAKVSALWNSVFSGASLRDALSAAAPDHGMYEAMNRIAEDLAQAIAGTPTELGQRTFKALKPWPSSDRMLKELATLSTDEQRSRDGDGNLVRIMTMRNSKGLEAETVFVVGLEEGAFPARDRDTAEFEEDARLFYVSMTRAKKELHLFHARKRSGGRTYKRQSFNLKKSTFLEALPKPHHEPKYHPSASKRDTRK